LGFIRRRPLLSALAAAILVAVGLAAWSLLGGGTDFDPVMR
jgi:hypothetical protein